MRMSTPQPLDISTPQQLFDTLHVQVCLITGGDSGIGRSVALMYAREGAEAIAISYLNEERDAEVRLTVGRISRRVDF